MVVNRFKTMGARGGGGGRASSGRGLATGRGRGNGRLNQEGKDGLRQVIGSVASARFLGKNQGLNGAIGYTVEVKGKSGKSVALMTNTEKQAKNLVKQLNSQNFKLTKSLPKTPGGLF